MRATQSSMLEYFFSPPMLSQRDSRAQRASAIESTAEPLSLAGVSAIADSAGRELLLHAERAIVITPAVQAVVSVIFTGPPLPCRAGRVVSWRLHGSCHERVHLTQRTRSTGETLARP